MEEGSGPSRVPQEKRKVEPEEDIKKRKSRKEDAEEDDVESILMKLTPDSTLILPQFRDVLFNMLAVLDILTLDKFCYSKTWLANLICTDLFWRIIYYSDFPTKSKTGILDEMATEEKIKGSKETIRQLITHYIYRHHYLAINFGNPPPLFFDDPPQSIWAEAETINFPKDRFTFTLKQDSDVNYRESGYDIELFAVAMSSNDDTYKTNWWEDRSISNIDLKDPRVMQLFVESDVDESEYDEWVDELAKGDTPIIPYENLSDYKITKDFTFKGNAAPTQQGSTWRNVKMIEAGGNVIRIVVFALGINSIELFFDKNDPEPISKFDEAFLVYDTGLFKFPSEQEVWKGGSEKSKEFPSIRVFERDSQDQYIVKFIHLEGKNTDGKPFTTFFYTRPYFMKLGTLKIHRPEQKLAEGRMFIGFQGIRFQPSFMDYMKNVPLRQKLLRRIFKPKSIESNVIAVLGKSLSKKDLSIQYADQSKQKVAIHNNKGGKPICSHVHSITNLFHWLMLEKEEKDPVCPDCN